MGTMPSLKSSNQQTSVVELLVAMGVSVAVVMAVMGVGVVPTLEVIQDPVGPVAGMEVMAVMDILTSNLRLHTN